MSSLIALFLPDDYTTVYLVPMDPATGELEDPGFEIPRGAGRVPLVRPDDLWLMIEAAELRGEPIRAIVFPSGQRFELIE